MATYTSNLNLKKPASNDYVNIADINGNMDILDKAVLIDNAQTITGVKTFNIANDPIIIKAPNIDGNTIPSSNLYSEIDVRDSAGREIGYFIRRHQSNGDANLGMVCKHTRLGITADISAFVSNNGDTYGIAPHRAYSSASNNEILVKSHVANMPVVHLTGNETIAGTKTIQNAIINYLTVAGTDYQRRIQINRTDDNANTHPASVITYPIVSWNDAGGNRVCALQVNHLTNGAYELRAAVRNADGTDKYITLVSGNA